MNVSQTTPWNAGLIKHAPVSDNSLKLGHLSVPRVSRLGMADWQLWVRPNQHAAITSWYLLLHILSIMCAGYTTSSCVLCVWRMSGRERVCPCLPAAASVSDQETVWEVGLYMCLSPLSWQDIILSCTTIVLLHFTTCSGQKIRKSCHLPSLKP